MGAGNPTLGVSMKALSAALAKLNPLAHTFLRLVLGVTMFWHGKTKFADTKITNVKAFFDFLGIPLPGVMAVVVAVLELVGGILIVLGIATRLVSVLFIVELLVAVFRYKYGESIGFIGPTEAGAELDWALIAGFFVLAAHGGGTLSVDHRMGLDPAPAA
jgi:putative oxidoreductase